MFSSRILGTGSYLPERILTNADLEKLVDTTDAWILERTGIRERHIAAEHEAASDVGVRAAERALEAAGLTANDIDVIICATVTGDQVMPSTACLIQMKLGCRQVMSFDVAAACSGFIYALSVADAFVRVGTYRRALVIGSEVLSRVVDYQDRGTCILFGDGAGAVVLGPSEGSDAAAVLGQHFYADGRGGELLQIPAGGSRTPACAASLEGRQHFLQMKGREVFKNAVRAMSECCVQALRAANMPSTEVDWLVPHQANTRIIDTVNGQLGLPSERIVMNIEKTGNTSSASIPIAFDEAVRDGRIRRGQNVLMTAFGAGLTSGALLLRY